MKLSHISSTKSRPFFYDSQILSNQQNLAKMDSGGGWGQDMRQATYDVRGDITTFRLSPVARRMSHVGRACRMSKTAPRRPHTIGKAFAWPFGLLPDGPTPLDQQWLYPWIVRTQFSSARPVRAPKAQQWLCTWQSHRTNGAVAKRLVKGNREAPPFHTLWRVKGLVEKPPFHKPMQQRWQGERCG